ncbi:dnaJ [Symbiodinium pilosum]|uniref:DnaJ protein n=1 Tax=Symbiodinium pilosum TaxID=2952 RepID=A0A812STC9_SYMPI|nr:dnaJ [Symbiodinium pilosum]
MLDVYALACVVVLSAVTALNNDLHLHLLPAGWVLCSLTVPWVVLRPHKPSCRHGPQDLNPKPLIALYHPNVAPILPLHSPYITPIYHWTDRCS